MVALRKLEVEDEIYFSKWWRDKALIALTSGNFVVLSDAEVTKYFTDLMQGVGRLDYMIQVNNKTIGHVNLVQRDKGWWETQIVIGEKEFWGRGYGGEAIMGLIKIAHEQGVNKIFLEVRPENVRAIKAYEKVGFKEVARIQYASKNQPETIRMEL